MVDRVCRTLNFRPPDADGLVLLFRSFLGWCVAKKRISLVEESSMPKSVNGKDLLAKLSKYRMNWKRQLIGI